MLRCVQQVLEGVRNMTRALVALMLAASASIAATAADTPRVYIAPADHAQAPVAKEKVRPVDLGPAIAAALLKKSVPVVVVTDPSRAEWTIKSHCAQKEEGTGLKIARLAFGGDGEDGTQVEATIQVVDNTTTEVRYAYNVKNDDTRLVAESFAKHFKDDLKKR